MNTELQSIRAMAQRRLTEIRSEASRQLAKAAANPGEIGEEAPGLEETFERAAEPAPGLSYRKRRLTQQERDENSDLDRPATRSAAVVVNAELSSKLADAIMRQRNLGSRQVAGDGRKTAFQSNVDSLAEALKAARERKRLAHD
jgi:hypothetical protein